MISKFRKSWIFKCMLVVLVMAIGVCINTWAEGNAEKDVKTLKAHHVMNTQHYYHTSAEKLKELLEESTGGTLKMEIFPSGQLGSDKEVLELLQSGDIAFAFGIPAAKLSSFLPEWDALTLPYLFQSEQEMIDWTRSEASKIMFEKLERGGFKGISYSSFSMRVPLSNKPLRSIEDFKGLKIRVMGTPVAIDTYKALGASPVPMPFGEVYMALQTGVVDACENGTATLYGQRFYEVADYLSTLAVLPSLSLTLMSKKVWDSLSQEEQKAIMDAEPEVFETTKDALFALNAKGLTEMKKAGIEVIEPVNPEDFSRALRGVWDKYLPKFEPWVQDIVKGILGDRY